VIDTADLYLDCHQRILRAVHELTCEGIPVDLVLVWERLRLRKWLADVGGKDYLAELWLEVPTGANAAYHAGVVRDCAVARALAHAASEVLRDALDRVWPADELAEQAVRKFEEIQTRYRRES
jgi:replicative DNA helicase